MKKYTCKKIGWILVLLGAINWGLVGLGMLFGGGNWNVINLVLGGIPVLEAIVYVLIGLSAIKGLFSCGACHSSCKDELCDSGSCEMCKEGTCEVHGNDSSQESTMSSSDNSSHEENHM